MNSRLPLSTLTDEQIRERADDYRRMAATATTVSVVDSLLRLAERFEALAAQRKIAENR